MNKTFSSIQCMSLKTLDNMMNYRIINESLQRARTEFDQEGGSILSIRRKALHLLSLAGKNGRNTAPIRERFDRWFDEGRQLSKELNNLGNEI